MPIVHKLPNSDGNTTWSLSGGTTRYELVDDNVADDPVGNHDDDSTYISKTGSNSSQIFDHDDFTISSGNSINNVIVTFRGRHLTGNTTQMRARITVGTTIYNGTYQALTDSYVTHAPEDWPTNPKTGNPWKDTEVNNTDGTNDLKVWRVQNNLTSGIESVRCTQTYISVDYNVGGISIPVVMNHLKNQGIS